MMKRHCLIIIMFFLTFISVNGQTKRTTCDCPDNRFVGTKADTTFYLSNGKAIVLCGYNNPEGLPRVFAGFVLAVCGQDTIIDFWGAVLSFFGGLQPCRLTVNKDTLLVDQLQNLPTGKDFKIQETVWTTEKIYFNEQKIERKLVVNRQIKKYNHEEIQAVLNAYETADPKFLNTQEDLLYKLFVAVISGDQKARQYFKEFENKFGTLEGDFAEEYRDLTVMLELWDKKE